MFLYFLLMVFSVDARDLSSSFWKYNRLMHRTHLLFYVISSYVYYSSYPVNCVKSDRCFYMLIVAHLQFLYLNTMRCAINLIIVSARNFCMNYVTWFRIVTVFYVRLILNCSSQSSCTDFNESPESWRKIGRALCSPSGWSLRTNMASVTN